ncbi:ovalbumin-related protein X-like isoform X2 [Aphidius gifuensis]|uniref:ovalbumin-related protein X-like isoform X2 n=1 Tax=Aphidius gifuensis TaxID=684658 RepID=UPI001CDD2384|nr:ovalbumin-related protein X-like isoform X2 [Aphidius gifuensis]
MINRSIVIGLIIVVIQMMTMIESKDMKKRQALEIVSTGINQFSMELYERLVSDGNKNNMIFSPLSVWMVLSMASLGSQGKTKSQLTNVLHLNDDKKIQNIGAKTLVEKLNALNNVELKIINKVFLDKNLELKKDYKNITKSIFKSTVDKIDFSNSINATNIINKWIQENTKSRIQEIIGSDELSKDTSLILVNAVYFKGQWKNKFDNSSTNSEPFYLDDGEIKNVSMMHTEGNFKIGYLPEADAEFIELPYASDNNSNAMSMIVMIPKNNTNLGLIERSLKNIKISRLLSGKMTEISLSLPKFTIESKVNLVAPLMDLGLTDMFDESANFSDIVNAPVKVSKVVQKAFIEVNEEGSEASAATGLVVELLSALRPDEFRIDRPFYYVIVDQSDDDINGTVVFHGRYTDPI